MHFVYGHGQVADSPGDEGAHILYEQVSFFDGETERVGQIVKWGRLNNTFYVSGVDEPGRIHEFYVKWSPIFQRYEAVN